MEGFDEDDSIALYIEYLIDNKGLLLDGITDDGEAIYLYDMDVLEKIAPEFAADHLKTISDSIISLYEKGLVEMEITDEGDVLYRAANTSDGLQSPAIQEETLD
jgi:predicted DNA-binding transcriptional regulator